MALITCPECQQQVSDRAETCPKCGFPLSVLKETNETHTPPISPSEKRTLPAKSNANKKHLNIAVIALVCIAAVVLLGIFAKQAADKKAAAEAQAAAEQASIEARETYISNLEAFLIKALAGGAKAENICNLTQNVWHDSIYEEYDSETAKYTRHNGVYWDDFSDAIRSMYSDEEISETVNDIEYSQMEVKSLYKMLQNPTEEFEKCYQLVDELYSVFFNFTNLAISPSGNYTTYSENFREYDSKFIELYEKLELLIPDTESDKDEMSTGSAFDVTYVLDLKGKVFHYLHCTLLDDLDMKSQETYTGQRQELIDSGYNACDKCRS